MSIIVQKYGGSSVKDPAHIQKVAGLIKTRRDEGHAVCVVVSAMGETTDDLLAQARQITATPSRRELDMLLTCGERATMALLAMALHECGVECISFTGSQSGIITNDAHSGARILEVRPYRVQDELERGRVVIVAGFQGVSYKKEITTLGRGGSDTTAVALAAALAAEACEIYSDVPGVFTADPRVVADARKLDQLDPDQMLALAAGGAKVLAQEAVAFARERGIALYARQTGSDDAGTLVRRDGPVGHNTVALAHRDRVLTLTAPDPTQLWTLEQTVQKHGAQVSWAFAGPAGGILAVPLDDAHGIRDALGPDVALHDEWGTVTVTGRSPAYIGGGGPVAARLLSAGITAHGMLCVPGAVTALISSDDVRPALQGLHDALRTEIN